MSKGNKDGSQSTESGAATNVPSDQNRESGMAGSNAASAPVILGATEAGSDHSHSHEEQAFEGEETPNDGEGARAEVGDESEGDSDGQRASTCGNRDVGLGFCIPNSDRSQCRGMILGGCDDGGLCCVNHACGSSDEPNVMCLTISDCEGREGRRRPGADDNCPQIGNVGCCVGPPSQSPANESRACESSEECGEQERCTDGQCVDEEREDTGDSEERPEPEPELPAAQTLAELIAQNPDLRQAAVRMNSEREYRNLLNNPDQTLTVFAPNDNAVERVLAQLLTDASLLSEVLSIHIVDRVVNLAEAGDGVGLLPTLHPTVRLRTGTVEGSFWIDTIPENPNGVATIVSEAIEASNGILYIVDTVLFPPGERVDDAEGSDQRTQE